jgi:hypothetical protein
MSLLKRKRSCTHPSDSNVIKKRKFKYEYTPDMKNQPVPLHYIYDRLATDEQIEELEKQLDLRKNIYKNMGQDSYMLIDTLLSIDRTELDDIIYSMIDDNDPIWRIEEEIENFLDEVC